MIRTVMTAVAIVALLVSVVSARQWSSRAGGFSVEAELMDVKDGDVILKKADGSQISVPLNKLSLSDVRYVNQELKTAEAGLGGVKSDESADSAQPSQEDPTAEAAKLSPEALTLLKKLRYGWKKGQAYVYRIRVIGDRGNDVENRTGEVTYKIKSTQFDEIQLAMSSTVKCERTSHSQRYILLPGPHVGYVNNADGSREAIVRIDPQGRILEHSSAAPLPYLLGDLSELVIEPLPPSERTSWTVESDPGVVVVSLHYPFCRFMNPGFREGVPAMEKTTYTVTGVDGRLINVSKTYELTSAETLAGKPRLEATGSGKLRFDTERGAFASLDYDIRVTVRDTNKTEDTPLRITYRLLSEQDVAEAEKDAQREKEEAKKGQEEKRRPLTDAEIATVLEDLGSDEPQRIGAATKLLADKKPKSANPKVAGVLENLLCNGENAHVRTCAAQALINWSTPENVPALLKAINDEWVGVQGHAIEALCKYKPKEAIKPVAALVSNPHTRGHAIKFLKSIGPDAEDVVLPQIESGDDWTRSEICQLLGAIGTKKSIPALEKAVTAENWMVNGEARKALKAIQVREGMDAASRRSLH